MITIWYEPHAQSRDNVAGVASGHRDVELTEIGRGQAQGRMRAKYEHERFDVVFTSDTRRAYDTARLVFEGRDIPIEQDERLRECDYGELEGHAVAQVAAARANAVTTPFPNGESYEEVALRVGEFLRDLARRDGEKVMFVAHSAVLWSLMHLVDGTPLAEAVGYWAEDLPVVFEYRPERDVGRVHKSTQ